MLDLDLAIRFVVFIILTFFIALTILLLFSLNSNRLFFLLFRKLLYRKIDNLIDSN